MFLSVSKCGLAPHPSLPLYPGPGPRGTGPALAIGELKRRRQRRIELYFSKKGEGEGKFILIVSASRSPPGLCSNLRSSVRVPNEYTFRVTFRIIFGPFGIIFEACLGPWGHFGGAVGSLFASKISLGLQRCPKGRHPGNKLTLLETF